MRNYGKSNAIKTFPSSWWVSVLCLTQRKYENYIAWQHYMCICELIYVCLCVCCVYGVSVYAFIYYYYTLHHLRCKGILNWHGRLQQWKGLKSRSRLLFDSQIHKFRNRFLTKLVCPTVRLSVLFSCIHIEICHTDLFWLKHERYWKWLWSNHFFDHFP